jgi:UDP-N-acetyl-D-galactosamine dehydrogenase
MRWKQDFHVGYSPERINPGDKEHSFARITKVVSGDDDETLEKVAGPLQLGGDGGRVPRLVDSRRGGGEGHREHAARPEHRLRERARDHLRPPRHRYARSARAAGTKWNFLPFRPGLVGGHCIGVDPYYLTYKAELSGYHPEVILAGRRINDGMGRTSRARPCSR